MSTELFDVEMPDGTVVSGIPKGTTQSEVMRRYSLQSRPPAGALNPIPPGLAGPAEAPLTPGSVLASVPPATKRLYDAATNPAPGAETMMGDPGIGFLAAASTGGPATEGMRFGEAFQESPVAQAGRSLLDKVKSLRGPGRSGAEGMARATENALAPKGAESKAVAQTVAPQLTEQSGISPSYTQRVYDQRLLDQFEASKAQLHGAAEAIPAGKTVAKQPVMDALDSAIGSFQIPTEGEPLQFNHEAVNKLIEIRSQIDKFGEQIPFTDLRKARQLLDKAIEDSGGWKEAASSADRASLQAMRKGAGVLRQSMKGISPELDAANQAFSMYADPAYIIKHRQLMDVARPSNTLQTVKKLLPYGAATSIGAGYELWKHH